MCFRPAQIQMNNCPECGKLNKPIAKVCIDCGAALSMAAPDIECPLCSHMNPSTATKCANCGATEQEIMAAMNKPLAAPKAPGAPAAPKAPAAPGVPKAPGTPPAPPKA